MKFKKDLYSYRGFIFFMVTLLLSFHVSAELYGTKYLSLKKDLKVTLYKTLSSLNVCSAETECKSQEKLFLDSTKCCLNITVYSVPSVDKGVLIAKSVSDYCKGKQDCKVISLEVFRGDHPKNWATLFGKEDPFLTLTFKED